MEKKSVIAIVGPTAVGKTALSLQIAKHFDGEVINGDSMQVYKDFWIGTAKIRQDEQQGVPHHLLDICNLEEEYNVARFQKDVRDKIEEICQRGHLPIIVGGTGLYIQAALYDFKFEEEAPNPARRRELETVAQMNGAKFLHQILQRLSSQAADDIHPNNIKRVIRAIEKLENGESLENQPQTLEPLYNIIWLGLEMNRQVLYSRINHRVDLMMEQGLLEEAKRLFEMKQTLCGLGCAIGYKELFPYFKGEVDLETAVNLVKQHSRNYAKRQYTYFRNKLNMHWIDMTDGLDELEERNIFSYIEGKIKCRVEKE